MLPLILFWFPLLDVGESGTACGDIATLDGRIKAKAEGEMDVDVICNEGHGYSASDLIKIKGLQVGGNIYCDRSLPVPTSSTSTCAYPKSACRGM